MSKLAIHGGSKTRTEKFPAYLPMGEEERDAVIRTMDSRVLSRFRGSWCDDFYGGPNVLALEKEWAKYFGVKHAIAVNSATSALYAAVGATGVGPGDEVIVSPYTMCASSTSPLIYGAVPVFADIEKEFYCLDPDSVEKRITSRTKAIVVVDIFGQPYNAERINALAKKHGLLVIEDAAQAPYAFYGASGQKKMAGTLGDIGIYSFNYHKHIHSGEGGMIVTNNDKLAEKLCLIRNHGEAVIGDMRPNYTNEDLVNIVGFNYRLPELEAAILREQLKKLQNLVEARQENVKYLEQQLSQIPCLSMPKVRPNCSHDYYMHIIEFNKDKAGISRNKFVSAVKAELSPIELRETEGVKVGEGYVQPLYLQPLFQKRIAFGKDGYPWSSNIYQGSVSYERGLCPTVENLYSERVIVHELMRPGMEKKDLDDVAKAFHKVWECRGELK